MSDKARKTHVKMSRLLFPISVSVLMGKLAMFLTVCFGSFLMNVIDFDKESTVIVVFSCIAVFLDCLVTGVLCSIAFSRVKKDIKFQLSLITGIISVIVLLSLNLLIFKDEITFLTFLKMIVIVLLTLLFAIRPKIKHKK